MISDEICLIGLSGKMGSGKDTIAEMLVEYSNGDFVLNSFGRMIREEIDSVIKDSYLLNEEELEDKYDVNFSEIKRVREILGRESIFERSEKSREGLQYWGTNVRRSQNELYWIDLAERKIKRMLEKGERTILTDVRFPEEADLIRKLNGTLLRLEAEEEVRVGRIYARDGIKTSKIALSHSSETSLDNYFEKLPDNERNIINANNNPKKVLKDTLFLLDI